MTQAKTQSGIQSGPALLPKGNLPDQDQDFDPNIWKIAAVVLLGPLMTSLDSTVVNVSLSTLGQDLHVPLTTIQWVTTGYLLALALMLPLSGWLVDRIGAKRVYLICFSAFTLASLLCATATTAAALIAARVLQGMAGGLIAPMAQMMVARGAGNKVAKVMSVMVVPVLIGPIAGPTLAGAILQHASWPWIFLINLPIGLLAILLALWILPPDHPQLASIGKAPRAFDFLGFALLSPSLILLLYCLENLSTAPSNWPLDVAGFVLAASLLVIFYVHASRAAQAALIDVQLFRIRSFAAAVRTTFLSNSIAFGGQMLLPLYLITIRGLTPQASGILLASAGLGMLCSYPSMGFFTDHFGVRRVSAVGALISLLGTIPFALVAPSALPTWAVCAALFLRGAGMGAIGIPSIAAAYTSIPRESIPVATTALNIVQRLGGPIATTLLATFLHVGAAFNPTASPSSSVQFHALSPAAFIATFWLLTAIHAITLLATFQLPLRATRAKSTSNEPGKNEPDEPTRGEQSLQAAESLAE